jgi:hypothetical protein
VISLKETPSVREIEKMLGFDSVMPINATPSDSADMIDKDQELKDWYEFELKHAYAFLFEGKNNEYDDEYKDYI